MKDISNTVRTEFYRSNFIAVDLLEFHFSTPVYLATGGIDISFDSPTAPSAGVNNYTAQGSFMGFTGFTEDFDVRLGKFAISLSGVGNNYVIALIGTNLDTDRSTKVNYEGARVVIYKAFLNVNTLAIVGDPLMIFDGSVFNVGITESANSCTINIECSTLFSDFDRTAGRKTNNGSNWLFQGSTYDTSMEQSGYVGNTEFKWGRT